MAANEKSVRLNLRLSPELYGKLGVIADDLGMAKSTVGAFAVAHYVSNVTAQRKAQAQQLQAVEAELKGLFSDPVKAAQLASSLVASGAIEPDSDLQLDIED